MADERTFSELPEGEATRQVNEGSLNRNELCEFLWKSFLKHESSWMGRSDRKRFDRDEVFDNAWLEMVAATLKVQQGRGWDNRKSFMSVFKKKIRQAAKRIAKRDIRLAEKQQIRLGEAANPVVLRQVDTPFGQLPGAPLGPSVVAEAFDPSDPASRNQHRRPIDPSASAEVALDRVLQEFCDRVHLYRGMEEVDRKLVIGLSEGLTLVELAHAQGFAGASSVANRLKRLQELVRRQQDGR